MTLYNCIFRGFPGNLVNLFLVHSSLTRFHVFMHQLRSGNMLFNCGQSGCSVGLYERPSTWRDLFHLIFVLRTKRSFRFTWAVCFALSVSHGVHQISVQSLPPSGAKRQTWRGQCACARCTSLDTKTVGGARNILSARTRRCETRGDRSSSSFSPGRV